jgi:hypothetical protein
MEYEPQTADLRLLEQHSVKHPRFQDAKNREMQA